MQMLLYLTAARFIQCSDAQDVIQAALTWLWEATLLHDKTYMGQDANATVPSFCKLTQFNLMQQQKLVIILMVSILSITKRIERIERIKRIATYKQSTA